MSKDKNDQHRKSLLNQLEELRANSSENQNEYINGLIIAIEQESNLKIWAEIDPLEHLPVPVLKTVGRYETILAKLSIVRNTLVFLPVGLTWLAISIASSAFIKFTTDNQDNVANFLDFWQNGYGYFNNFWKLSNVAFFDALLVALVITITFGISYVSQLISRIEKQEYIQEEAKRFKLAIDIKTYLFQFKYPISAREERAALTAIKNLNKSSSLLLSTIQILQKNAKSLPSNSDVTKLFKKLIKIEKSNESEN